MSSSQNTMSLPAGDLPESIESRWTHFREFRWGVIRDALLAIVALGALSYTSSQGSSGRLSVLLAGAITLFLGNAGIGVIVWAFQRKYVLNVEGVTIKCPVWFTEFMAWDEVEKFKVYDPGASFWHAIFANETYIKIRGARRLMFRKSVDLDTTKFDDIGEMARYVLNHLPEELQHDEILRRWADVH